MLVSHEQMVRPCWDPSAGGRVEDVSVEGTIMAVGGQEGGWVTRCKDLMYQAFSSAVTSQE